MKKQIIWASMIAFVLIFALSGISKAQPAPVKPEVKPIEIIIKTSAQCDECKERIEKAMSKVKGVEKSVLDVDKKLLTVNFYPDKVTPDEIRKAITKVGYDADNMPANEKAYKKLPKCCQKPD